MGIFQDFNDLNPGLLRLVYFYYYCFHNIICNLTGLTGGASQTSTPYGKANHEGLPHYDKELMRAYIMVFDANNQVNPSSSSL